ncbi:MAG: Bug family tripartite tricarboxylate transporter substrate binding protein [Rhodanobacter sp.]
MILASSKVRTFLASLCLSAAALTGSAQAQTEAYPINTVHVVVPFPAGGLVDSIGRLLMREIASSTEKTIVVENRGGAGGSVGAGVVAKATPDGYTLLLALDSFAINPLVYKDLPYDTRKDFLPISLIARAPMVAVANAKFAPNSLSELVKYAKGHPTEINFGSVGAGSSGHLTAELFNMKADNIAMTHVPYKGGAPAQTDLMAGRIQFMWGTAPYAQKLVATGKIKALGQASATRSAAFPDLPTAVEQGFADFEVYGWIGLLAPAGTPPSVVAFWNKELTKAVKEPTIAKRLAEQGFEVVVSSPEIFSAFIYEAQKTWGKVIKEKNIPLQ